MRRNRALASGVRSISHRESRVQFYDFFASMAKLGGPGPIGWAHAMVEPLLVSYMRLYV